MYLSIFHLRYMERVQQMYYYPFAIVFAVAVGSIGYKIYASFTVHGVPLMIYIVIVVELIELAWFCAMGTVVDICVCVLYILCLCRKSSLYWERGIVALFCAQTIALSTTLIYFIYRYSLFHFSTIAFMRN